MAAKLAVVVTAVGNIPSLLSDRIEACFVSPKNPTELTSVLSELIVDEKFRIELAGRGHYFAAKNFSTEIGIQKLINEINLAVSQYKVYS